MSEAQKPRGGRKEVLTLELARKVVKLIERMPDGALPVTWKNVEAQVKRQFGKQLRRNVLSQKTWNGRKLISDAFNEAKDVQRRLLKQRTPKYANSSRAVLRERIEQLEAKVATLQQELETTRLAQYTQLDLFRVTRLDLRLLAENVQRHKET